jgi:hypothetical protein
MGGGGLTCHGMLILFFLPLSLTHGYGSVTASPYSVEEVSGSRPGRVILKTLKIVPTASLFGAEHIKS